MGTTLQGILNVDKPRDWTSHDVVARVRRLTGTRRVGHAGTLDPMATGVLLVCLGQATRVTEYLMRGQKTYVAVARLGLQTDTYDVDGKVVATAKLPPLSNHEIETVLLAFTGTLSQVPPQYSAVKHRGVPAYRLARQGKAVALAARRVTIYRIMLLDWTLPRLTLEVQCSPGTYIRSLIHDIGQDLGCGATLCDLRRTRSGHFSSETSVTVEALAEVAGTGDWQKLLHPTAKALEDLLPVTVDAHDRQVISHGGSIPCINTPEAMEAYALGEDGEVLAILEYAPAKRAWQPRKVLTSEAEPFTRQSAG